ncbi:MAG TPA: hypothetical protein VLY87_03280 [Flavobacterium sp.]|nr:hypothetical protein [Flavobacterium sp.]
MKEFYLKSYWFWLLSKSILIIMLLLSTLNILGEGNLNTTEFSVNLLGLIEAFLLMATLSQDYFFLKKFYFLKTIAGGILILAGIALFIFLFTVSEGSQSAYYLLGYPLAVWLILIGIFDLLRIKKATP